MGKITVNGMISVEKTKKERVEALKTLTSKPFNINDEQQLADLRRYINDFEFNLNQMYLFQGLSTGLSAWLASWGVSVFLPIPQWINYCLSIFLYCGAAGYILQNFKMTDFYSQLDEMKIIYNWCLKNNQIEFDGTDNTVTLSNPEIQRLIKLIAPLCSSEFMIVWKKVTEEEESKSTISSVFSYAYSMFSSSKPNVDLNRLQDLKASVERRELDVGVYKGVEGAVRYFATDQHFRELLMSRVKLTTEQTVESIKGIIPSVLSLGHSKSA